MAVNALSATWFYAISGQKLSGPFLQVKNLWNSKTITGDTLVWRDGMSGWAKISAVPDLLVLLALPTAAAPAPAPVTTPAPLPAASAAALASITAAHNARMAAAAAAVAAPPTAATAGASHLTIPGTGAGATTTPARSPTASPPPAASPKASGSLNTGGWLYVDPATGKQNQTSIDKLRALISAGSLDPSTFGWKEGMTEWATLSSMKEFKDLFAARAAAGGGGEWYYSDRRGQRQGGVSLQQLTDLYSKFELNDISLVWKTGMQKWERLSDVPELQHIPTAAQKALEAKGAASTPAATAAGGKASRWSKPGETAATTQAPAPATAAAAAAPAAAASSSSSSSAAAAATSDTAPAAADSKTDGKDGKPKKEKTEEEKKAAREKKKKRAKEKKAGKWVENTDHANVYVTGLPFDITMEEMKDTFKKGGIIKDDPDNEGQPRIKIYKDAHGIPKGDGLVSYLREESIQQAIDLIDETEIRPKYKIRVQKAEFKMKGQQFIKKQKTEDGKDAATAAHSDSSSSSAAAASGSAAPVAVSATEKAVLAAKKHAKKVAQTKDLSWASDDDEEEVSVAVKKGLRIVVLKHVFNPADAAGDPNFYDELRSEVGPEIEKKSGLIDKLTVFEGSPIGAVAVKFKSPASAEECIKWFNGRFFGGQQLEVDYFDGKTNYKVKVADDDEERRRKDFGDWLENDGNEDDKPTATAAAHN